MDASDVSTTAADAAADNSKTSANIAFHTVTAANTAAATASTNTSANTAAAASSTNCPKFKAAAHATTQSTNITAANLTEHHFITAVCYVPPATTPDIRCQGSPPLTSTPTGFTVSPPTNPPSVDSQYFSNIQNTSQDVSFGAINTPQFQPVKDTSTTQPDQPAARSSKNNYLSYAIVILLSKKTNLKINAPHHTRNKNEDNKKMPQTYATDRMCLSKVPLVNRVKNILKYNYYFSPN